MSSLASHQCGAGSRSFASEAVSAVLSFHPAEDRPLTFLGRNCPHQDQANTTFVCFE